MKRALHGIIIAAALIGGPAFAQQSLDHAAHSAAAPASANLTDGEVRNVDKDARKITLRHGAIENLGMPPMTMVFQVKDGSTLDKFKAGDKVRFAAVNESGAFIVTQIVPAQ